MKVTSVSHLKDRKKADVAIVPFWQHAKEPIKEFASIAKFPLSEGDFKGKKGETLLLYSPETQEKRLLLLGLGEKKEADSDSLRDSYAKAIKLVRAKRLETVNCFLPSKEEERLHGAAFEGALLANYAFDHLKGHSQKEGHPLLKSICFCGVDKAGAALLKKTETIMTSVNHVRDLVNGNADDVNVEMLKKIAKEIEKECAHVKITILDKKALEKEKMGLLLAVGKAAIHDPALIILEYLGDPKSKEKTAIVGKGITYDTGGLNLKVNAGMETMKCDMAGAAVALEIVRAASHLELKTNLVSVLAVAENAIGPGSYKPGDVYISRSGKTVEISNTDAEGRLVLADAISYTEEKYAPKRIIDFATLTGGVVIALGEEASGLFSNDDKLAKALTVSGERTGELVWRMPLYPAYKEYLKSTIADIKNSGARKASAGTGAIFIQQFVKSTPWAHLDIAGTAYLSESKSCHPTPATGVGIRLLVDFLECLKH